MTETLYIGNDNLVDITDVTNEATGAYINNATVTCTLKTIAGVNVAGQVWPTTATYVAASNGRYQANIEDGVVLVANNRYLLEIDYDAGGDVIAKRTIKCIARVRR